MWPGAMGEIRLHSYWAAAALWFAFWWEHHLLPPSSNQKVTALFNRALTAITEFPVSAGPLGLLKGASSPPQTQQSLVFSRKLPFKVNCHSVNWTLLVKKQRTTGGFFKD